MQSQNGETVQAGQLEAFLTTGILELAQDSLRDLL